MQSDGKFTQTIFLHRERGPPTVPTCNAFKNFVTSYCIFIFQSLYMGFFYFFLNSLHENFFSSPPLHTYAVYVCCIRMLYTYDSMYIRMCMYTYVCKHTHTHTLSHTRTHQNTHLESNRAEKSRNDAPRPQHALLLPLRKPRNSGHGGLENSHSVS